MKHISELNLNAIIKKLTMQQLDTPELFLLAGRIDDTYIEVPESMPICGEFYLLELFGDINEYASTNLVFGPVNKELKDLTKNNEFIILFTLIQNGQGQGILKIPLFINNGNHENYTGMVNYHAICCEMLIIRLQNFLKANREDSENHKIISSS